MDNSGTLTLKMPWGHIAAKTWGCNKNTPVLVVHGLLDNAGAFNRLIPELPTNFYYVCVDLPGHGFSSHFSPGMMLSYFNYVLTIKFILDELGWKETHYIGHSLGGHVGLFFTLIYKDRIKKIILIDAVVATPISDEQYISMLKHDQNAVIKCYNSNNPPCYSKEEVMFALENKRKSKLIPQAAKELFERSVTEIAEDSYCYNRDYRAKNYIVPFLNKEQLLYLLTKVKVQTFIIFTSETLPFLTKIKPDVQNIFKNLNNIQIIEVEGNHDVHNNHPERISGHISKYLNYIPNKL